MRDEELAAIWEEARPRVMARLAGLESAVAAAVDGTLTEDQRRQAESDAHKLAGSLGMFGFRAGSPLAAGIEQLLEGTAPLAGPTVDRLAEQVRALAAELGGKGR